MGAPIDRTAKTTLDANLVNGNVSDAPKLRNSDDVLYNYVDGLNAAQDAHAQAATLAHPDGSVKTAKIADGAVTTAKIADGAVTLAKLANNAQVNESVNNSLIVALKADTTQRGINVKYPPANLVAAKGDGVTTDDWAALQAIIDYGYNNKIKRIKIPSGTYSISKPLLLWDGMMLEGDSVQTTSIIKPNNTTLNDGSSYATVDAIIIFSNLAKNTGQNTSNQEIKNININGAISWTNKTFNAYGVVSLSPTSFIVMDDVYVSGDIGIQFKGNLWQSEFNNIWITPYHKGLSMLGLGTSNNLDKIYVMNCNATNDSNTMSYELSGHYSQASSLACDSGTGVLYYFHDADWVINGMGCEGCDNAISSIRVNGKSNVIVNGLALFGQFSSGSYVFDLWTNSELVLNGGHIGDKMQASQRTSLGALYQMGYNAKLTMNDLVVVDKYSVLPSNVDINNSPVIVQSKYTTPIGLYGNQHVRQYMGSIGSVDNYNPTSQISPKVIFLNVDNPYYNIDGTDYNGTQSVPIGTLFLTGNPSKYGCIGWVVTGQQTGANAPYLSGSILAKIPTILSGTTAQIPVNATYSITGGTFNSLDAGQQYYDTTIKKMLFWSPTTGWMNVDNVYPENRGINAAVAQSATTLAVTLPTVEANASYIVGASPAWNTTYWITGKTTTGFTINFGTAPASASTLDWTIRR